MTLQELKEKKNLWLILTGLAGKNTREQVTEVLEAAKNSEFSGGESTLK